MVGAWDTSCRYCSADSAVYIDLPLRGGFEYRTDPIQKLRGWDRVVAEAAELEAKPT